MRSKILSAAFVSALALPAFAAKLPTGAVFTEGPLTIDAGERATVKLNPNQVVLPGLEARPCNGVELTAASEGCAVQALLHGGKVSTVYCSVRAGRVQTTCILESEFGNPINW